MTDATFAVVNAHVWTGDPAGPWVDAVVAEGERIALVGSSAEARKRVASAGTAEPARLPHVARQQRCAAGGAHR